MILQTHTHTRPDSHTHTHTQTTHVVWAAVNTLEPNDVERHTALLLHTHTHTHTHTARLTNYTRCMSRSEHTWAQWCGTAHCTSVTHTHTHTRPDSQTTHVVWAAVNTLEPDDVERHTALLLHTHTHGQTHKLHILYEPQWTHLSPMMWNGTHTARLTNYTCCMSRSEHTIIITITIFSLLIRTNFNNYVRDHLNY